MIKSLSLVLVFSCVVALSPLALAAGPSCSEEISGLGQGSAGLNEKEPSGTDGVNSEIDNLDSSFATLRDLITRRNLKITRKDRKKWLEALEHLEGDLKEISADENTHANLIRQNYTQMVDNIAQMEKFVTNLGKAPEASYYRSILHAAFAFVSVHSHEVVDMENPSSFNLNRYLKIMKTLTNFSAQSTEFSMYQIKVAITEEFSLREFTKCKI